MRKLLQRLEALFAAVAFAEEGEADTARELADEADGSPKPRRTVVRLVRPAPAHPRKVSRLP